MSTRSRRTRPSGSQIAERKLPREDRLAAAKARALRFIEAGDLVLPLTSMWHDTMLGRNPLYPREEMTERLVDGIELASVKDVAGLFHWIESFT